MSNYMEQCDCYGYCDESPCPACWDVSPESTTTRLRAVRVRLDAARTEAAVLDIEWRRLFNDFLPYQNERGPVADSYRLPAAKALAARHADRNELDALEAEYLALAMELAEEVCR